MSAFDPNRASASIPCCSSELVFQPYQNPFEPLRCRLLSQGPDMQRRDFVVLLAATVAWPVAALAQPSERIRRVGILVGSAESDPNIQAWIAEVQNGLAALGWRNGHNVHFERRFAGGDVDRTEHHAQELVRLDLDVIVT